MARAAKKSSAKKPNAESSSRHVSSGTRTTELASQLSSLETTSMMQLWSEERNLDQLPFSEWQANQGSGNSSHHHQNGSRSNNKNGY